jgi:FkbM family methyltransferase
MKYVWRFRVLFFWLIGKGNETSLLSLLRNIARPPFKKRSQKYIESIEENSSDYIIKIKNYSSPLFFPKNIGLDALYHIICEICDKDDWHFYEVPETRVTVEDIVVDCGAAEGLFSLTVKDRCSHVYIIEPLPSFLESLVKTFQNDKNITIIPTALGSSSYKSYITNDGMAARISKRQTKTVVNVETIDNLFFHQNIKITYIKADIEGNELEMLAGARLTIEKYHPTIAITTYHHPTHTGLISAFLKDICSDYIILTKGIEDDTGGPKLLHAWIPKSN